MKAKLLNVLAFIKKYWYLVPVVVFLIWFFIPVKHWLSFSSGAILMAGVWYLWVHYLKGKV